MTGISPTYFNSIKVRLEQKRINCYFPQGLFQFHKGTIRTHTQTNSGEHIQYFNSIKVRLERPSVAPDSAQLLISIP